MFKKISVITAVFLLLTSLWIVNSVPAFGEYFKCGEVYLSADSSHAFLSVDKDGYAGVFFRCGECFTAEKDFDLKDFLSEYSAKIIFSENDCAGVSVYAYSPKIKYGVQINGKTVNLHIRFGKEIKVGAPFIFGSL